MKTAISLYGEMITKKLNEVYEKIDQNEFARDMDVGLESLRNLTKNDAWWNNRYCSRVSV